MFKKIALALTLFAAIALRAQTPFTVNATDRPWIAESSGFNSAFYVSGLSASASGSSPVTIPVTPSHTYQINYISGLANNHLCPSGSPDGWAGHPGAAPSDAGHFITPPPNTCSLIGAWTDSSGNIIGIPIFVGKIPPLLTAPGGAAFLSLGLNDGFNWGDNSGSWNEEITDVTAPVTTGNQYGLSGTIVGPDNTPFNGTLTVELTKPTALNICTDPYSIVVQKEAKFQVVNGLIVNGTSAKFITNACLTPSIPYYVQMFDTQQRQVYADNWWLPRANVANVDVALLHDVGYYTSSGTGQQTGTNSTATPIIVAIPGAIISNPAGTQTITQPSGTSLIVNNLTVTGTFIASGTLSGSISGNAATASAFDHSPTLCGAGSYPLGILANGDATGCTSVSGGSAFGVLQITGGSSSYTTQGDYLNWNISGSTGETDFVNAKGSGAGGFNFYNIADAGTPTTPIVSIDGTGNISAASFIGPLTGTASLATALAGTPSLCSSGFVANGILPNGDANCVSLSGGGTGRTCNANGCYQIGSDGTYYEWGKTPEFDTGPILVVLPHTLPTSIDNIQITQCVGITTQCSSTHTEARGWMSLNLTTTTFQIRNNGTGAAQWQIIGH